MILDFKVVPHKKQRYKTVGDYLRNNGRWTFRSSRLKDTRHVWLVWQHEFIEWSICRILGVKNRDIDRYDIAYEKGRQRKDVTAPCGCRFKEDPGDDIHAPYHEAHAVASQCERLIAKALGVDWVKYDEAVMRL